MSKESFYKYFVFCLEDLYNMENQIMQTLPKIVNSVTNPEVRKEIEKHLEETDQQIIRLETIFTKLNLEGYSRKCLGMEGILKEGENLIKLKEFSNSILNAAIINLCQKIEHYEMAAYGAARTYAHLLDLKEVENLLQQSLNEEGDSNKKLMQKAEGTLFATGLNKKARDEG